MFVTENCPYHIDLFNLTTTGSKEKHNQEGKDIKMTAALKKLTPKERQGGGIRKTVRGKDLPKDNQGDILQLSDDIEEEVCMCKSWAKS